MVLTAPDPSHSVWFIHVSRLSGHTQDLLKDRRVSLMLALPERRREGPAAARAAHARRHGDRARSGSPEEASAKEIYLGRFPHMAEIVGQLGDFSFWVIRPKTARFVGGFARAFTLDADALRAEIAAGRRPPDGSITYA